MTRLSFGHIWPAPRVLVYPASGLLLGRPPLLSFFPHSSQNSSETGFTISTKLKAQILLLPGSYFCCPFLQEQIHSTMWTDEISVGEGWMALPIQIKLKNPSQFPHPKKYPFKP
jgi:hypothetical protein